MRRVPPLLPLACLALLSSACAQPVLYPNAHFQKVGEATAQDDVRACMSMADSAGADRSAGLPRETASGAAVGAAAGAAGGAVAGDAGQGAAVGAAAGAVSRFARGIFGTGDDHTVYRGFVNRCLADKGYDVTGWN